MTGLVMATLVDAPPSLARLLPKMKPASGRKPRVAARMGSPCCGTWYVAVMQGLYRRSSKVACLLITLYVAISTPPRPVAYDTADHSPTRPPTAPRAMSASTLEAREKVNRVTQAQN